MAALFLINNFFFAPRPGLGFFSQAAVCARYFQKSCVKRVNRRTVFHAELLRMTGITPFPRFRKKLRKKAKARPKNRLPNSISYRRPCSHFNYYLILRDEHVATRPLSFVLSGDIRGRVAASRSHGAHLHT